MNQIQRYVLRRLLGSFAIAFPALAITIWLTQALGRIDLVTDRGQGLDVFIQATILFLPGLVTIIGPVSMLIATIVTLNGLQSDSELVSLNAGGGAPRLLLKPFLALAIPVVAASAASTLYFGPITVHASNLLIANVNASVISTLIQPGQFKTLGGNVTVNVRSRRGDGTLENVFVFDQRTPQQTATYIAATGAVVDNEAGRYLLLQDGVIQRLQPATGTIATIEFESYAFDLSSLAGRTTTPALRPNERSTAYILDPNPNDPVLVENPDRYKAELHNRLTTPLYVLVLALIPLAILGPVQSVRQSRVVATIMAAALAGAALGLNLFLGGVLQNDYGALPLIWAVPIAGIVLPVLAIYRGRRINAPRWLSWIAARLSFRRRRVATA